MRVKVCVINVGGGVGNRSVCMERFSYVDVFMIVDPPVGVGGGFVHGEENGFDLFSFCEGSVGEVFVRREMVGLFLLGVHNDVMVTLEYENREGGSESLGGVYLRPRDGSEYRKSLDRIVDCDVLVGDWNARNVIWGGKGGDKKTSTRGRDLESWMKEKDYKVVEHDKPTFRNIS